jgi:dihydroorotate dehydrogenase
MKETYTIGHLEVETPWANAGGVVKHVHEVASIASTGVGWIEAGSYTLEARLGNEWNEETKAYDKRVYFHNSDTSETYNSLGMPNKGMDVVETEIAEMKKEAQGKPLIVNVAPVTHEPIQESIELVTRAYEAGADAVLLNASCPNVVTQDGSRHEILSNSPEALSLVLEGLQAVTDTHKPIFIRISPTEMRVERVKRVTDVIRASGVISAVFAVNTWPSKGPYSEDGEPIIQVPGNLVGKSGVATASESTVQGAWVKQCLGHSPIDLVSCGGIMTGQDLQQRLAITRATAGAGTTFFYEAKESWEEAVDKLLREFIDAYS